MHWANSDQRTSSQIAIGIATTVSWSRTTAVNITTSAAISEGILPLMTA